jgi:DnaJ-class molecular chaperone
LACHQRASLGDINVEPQEIPMKTPFANPTEQRCQACDGTGFPVVKQPAQPGRRTYPPPCKECDGKGRTPKANK